MLTVEVYFVHFFLALFVFQTKCQSDTKTVHGLTPDEQNFADQCFNSSSFSCNPNAKYRTMDGSCNNLQKPWWGAADTPYTRLVKPAYKDSNNGYRVSVADGNDLPGARLVSATLLKPNTPPILQDSLTRLYMVFSQLVSHDVLLNPQSGGDRCCSDSGDKIASTEGKCHPIPIPDNDNFYSSFGRKCLDFRQSLSLDCAALKSGPLIAISRTTHYMDASFLYGFNENNAKSLRTLSDGKLRTQSDALHQYLVTRDIGSCPFAKKNCYGGGDGRVNQHLDLAVMETIFLRFHNFIVDNLVSINPQWKDNDETLFQEARRFVIASFQHIVYNEWLPILLGPDTMKAKGLSPAPSGFSDKYKSDVNPSSLMDFAGAAFRTLHSMTPDKLKLGSQTMPFSNTFQRPGDFLQEPDNFDAALASLLTEHPLQLSHFNSDEIRNWFVQAATPLVNGSVKFGDDLTAIDVQRGRDYGLSSYNDYRTLFNMTRFSDYKAVATEFGNDSATLLAQVYKHPDDIDFYVGSLYELTSKNITATSTLQAVWAEAFQRYQIGDRYFYERGDQPWSFTLDQLSVIKKIKLAHVVCIGFDNRKSDIHHNVLLAENSESNAVTNCDTLLQQLDFSSFKA